MANALKEIEHAQRLCDRGDITIGEYFDLVEKWEDAEPTKHGRWKYVRDHIDQEHRVFECTICGQEIAFHNKYRGLEAKSMPYCFHCGSRMDGGENDRV